MLYKNLRQHVSNSSLFLIAFLSLVRDDLGDSVCKPFSYVPVIVFWHMFSWSLKSSHAFDFFLDIAVALKLIFGRVWIRFWCFNVFGLILMASLDFIHIKNLQTFECYSIELVKTVKIFNPKAINLKLLCWCILNTKFFIWLKNL